VLDLKLWLFVRESFIKCNVRTIGIRVLKLLENKGYITKEEESSISNSIESVDAFNLCQKAGIVYRIAFGPRKGQKILTISSPQVGQGGGAKVKKPLCSNYEGFSLHAGVSVKKGERKKLENIVGYICRPAISLKRLSLNGQGQVVVELKNLFFPMAQPTMSIHLMNLSKSLWL